jgi:hypothetical protein
MVKIMGCGSSNVKEPVQTVPVLYWKGRPVDFARYDYSDLIHIYDAVFGEKKDSDEFNVKYLEWVHKTHTYHLFPKKDKFGRFNLSELIDFMIEYKIATLFRTSFDFWIKIFDFLQLKKVFVNFSTINCDPNIFQIIDESKTASVILKFGINEDDDDEYLIISASSSSWINVTKPYYSTYDGFTYGSQKDNSHVYWPYKNEKLYNRIFYIIDTRRKKEQLETRAQSLRDEMAHIAHL